MREIVFDTETTGLDPIQGDRLVEIGCIELVNRFPSGKTFHCYFNPERDMPDSAFKVHGLSIDFLKDKPLFVHKVEELIEFLGDAPLIAHNAMFDLGLLNAELERAKKAAVARERLVDTLMLARRKHPGGSNRLEPANGIHSAIRRSRWSSMSANMQTLPASARSSTGSSARVTSMSLSMITTVPSGSSV